MDSCHSLKITINPRTNLLYGRFMKLCSYPKARTKFHHVVRESLGYTLLAITGPEIMAHFSTISRHI